MLVPITLYALAVTVALLQPRSRAAYVFALLVYSLLIGGNLVNPDSQAYEENYEGLFNGNFDPSFEPGYQALARACSVIGLPYQGFVFVMAVSGLLLSGSTVRRFTDRPALVMAMYAAYPLFWDYVQLRNFMAMSVLVFGARYLISADKHRLRYMLCVAVAATFHISALIFMIMPLAGIRQRRTFYVVALVSFAAYFYVLQVLFANPLFAFLVHKIESYTGTETSDLTKAAVVLFHGATLLLVAWAGHELGPRGPQAVAPTRAASRGREGMADLDTTTVFRMFVLAGFFLPLATINLDFMRLFRNMFFLSAILFARAIPVASRRSTGRWMGLSVALYLGACFFGLVSFLSVLGIIWPLFESNILSVN